MVTVSHLSTSLIFAGKDGSLPLSVKLHEGLHDIQHNDTQHNGIQSNGLICDIQHK